MAARVVHCFASSVCEALPVQLVNDIFFQHERGKRLGYYTGTSVISHSIEPPVLTRLSVCLCFGATGPLYAGYMLAGGYSWRLFFYVEFAFGCALLILAFFAVEETLYHRKPPAESIRDSSSSQNDDEKNSISKAITDTSIHVAELPPRKTFLQTLKFWGAYDKDTEFFLMMARSFTYFLVPHVLWVITTYGGLPPLFSSLP